MVALVIASQTCQTRGRQPVEVAVEPPLDRGKIGLGEGFGASQKRHGLCNFRERNSFEDALEAACPGRTDRLRIEKGRGHAGCWIDEPGFQMGYGMGRIARIAGEHKSRGQCGNLNAQAEKCIAMRREGVGIRQASPSDIRSMRSGGIGPVILRLGVEVVGRAWAARCGSGGERSRGLSQGVHSGMEDAVMIDGGYIWMSRRCGLGQEQTRSDQEGGNVRAEGAPRGGHNDEAFAEEYHDGESCSSMEHGRVGVNASSAVTADHLSRIDNLVEVFLLNETAQERGLP